MRLISSIFNPVTEFFRKVWNFIKTDGDIQHLSHHANIFLHFINFERFAVIFSLFSITLLLTADTLFIASENLVLNLVSFFLFLILSIFYSNVKVNFKFKYHLFYSTYYIIAFLMLFYLPEFISHSEISIQKYYILGFVFISFQAFRPGRFVGIFVIAAVFINLFCFQMFSGIPFTKNELLSIFMLSWFSGIILAIEAFLLYLYNALILIREKNSQENYQYQLAKVVHDNLFPEFKGNKFLKFYSYRKVQNMVGGDFFEVFNFREKNIGILFSDISGHGISSAMMSAALKNSFRSVTYKEKINPAEFLSFLDGQFYNIYSSHHASAIYLYFNFSENKVIMANAGHPYLLMSKQNEDFKEVKTRGNLLGFNLHQPPAEELSFNFKSGDRFFVYTDGLIEYTLQSGRIETVENLTAIINKHQSKPGNALIESVRKEIESSKNFNFFQDDVLIGLMEII